MRKFIIIFIFIVPLFIYGQEPGGGPGNGNGDPCDGPNPPPQCNEPCWPPPCIPINNGIWVLAVGGLWLAYKKRNKLTKK